MSKEKIKIEENSAPESEKETREGKVGTMLHDVRVKKKLTIEDIAEKLRIKAAYLNAIEQSDYDKIPAHPYGVGFVRSYAVFLGLNDARIVQIFKEETEGSASPNLTHKKEITTQEGDNDIYSPNYKYIIISLALLLIGYFLWTSFTQNEVTEEQSVSSSQENDYPLQVETYTTAPEENSETMNNDEPDNQITVTDAEFTEEEKEQPQTTESKEQPEEKPADVSTPKKQGRVVLKIKKETWVEVKDKDKLWISKVLNAGDEYVLPDNGEGKTVSFGNTDGVDVEIDGKVVTVISNDKKTNIKMDPFLGNH